MSNDVGYSGITASGAGYTGSVPVASSPPRAPAPTVGYSGITASGAGYTGSAPTASRTSAAHSPSPDYNGILTTDAVTLTPLEAQQSSVDAFVQDLSDLEIDGLLEAIVDGRVMNDQQTPHGHGLETPLLAERSRRQQLYIEQIDEYPIGILTEDELRRAVGASGGRLSDSHTMGNAFAKGFSGALRDLEVVLKAYSLVQGLRAVPKTYSGVSKPSVDDKELKGIIDQLWRKKATFGNGGTAERRMQFGTRYAPGIAWVDRAISRKLSSASPTWRDGSRKTLAAVPQPMTCA